MGYWETGISPIVIFASVDLSSGVIFLHIDSSPLPILPSLAARFWSRPTAAQRSAAGFKGREAGCRGLGVPLLLKLKLYSGLKLDSIESLRLLWYRRPGS